jgi:hypothetical protein
LKKCDFLPGTAILLKKAVNLDIFRTSPSFQILKLNWKRHLADDSGAGRRAKATAFAQSPICHLQLACPDLGARFAVTSSIFTFRP